MKVLFKKAPEQSENNSAPDNFDYHKYRYWSKYNLIHTSYFQSLQVFILAKLILVF